MQCSEAYKWATLNSHQLHGGMGYVLEQRGSGDACDGYGSQP